MAQLMLDDRVWCLNVEDVLECSNVWVEGVIGVDECA